MMIEYNNNQLDSMESLILYSQGSWELINNFNKTKK